MAATLAFFSLTIVLSLSRWMLVGLSFSSNSFLFCMLLYNCLSFLADHPDIVVMTITIRVITGEKYVMLMCMCTDVKFVGVVRALLSKSIV